MKKEIISIIILALFGAFFILFLNFFQLGVVFEIVALFLLGDLLFTYILPEKSIEYQYSEPELYSKQWFINKFKEYDNDETGKYSLNNHCALYHVGVGKGTGDYYNTDGKPIITDESTALIMLFGGKHSADFEVVWDVNDNSSGKFSHLGDTPKQRILNKLKSLP